MNHPFQRHRRRLTLTDAILVALLAAAGVWLYWRVRHNLHYNWNWGVIPQYLVRFDAQTGSWKINLLLEGLFTTIRLSVWATVGACLLGILAGLARTSKALFPRLLGGAYVEAIRNLPPLVLVFIFYFFFAQQIMPVLGADAWARSWTPGTEKFMTVFFAPASRFSAFLAAVITLALYEGAYITEIVRAGVQSVERGQWEAAHALGLSRWQRMRHVIGPQALSRIVPPLAGQFISTIKDSAIVSVISIQELTFQGLELMAATYLTFEVWTTILVMYMVLTLTCSLAARRVERAFSSR